MENEVAKDDFSPRSYQSEIMEIAVRQNTIIYLPTGSGKTYIAILLINRLSHDIVRPPGTKLTVFLVNTVSLVEQHCASITRHTDFDVGKFSGDLNVDIWTHDQWTSQLNKYQVIVLTAQIFLDVLRHGYFSLEKVNLLIFDECHQAVNDQPMRQIMQLFMNVDADKQPRVLGLTATLLNGNCSPARVQEEVRSLETTFHSKVATVRELSQVTGYSTNPQEKIIHFAALEPCDVLTKIFAMLDSLINNVSAVKLNTNKIVSPSRMPLLTPPKESKTFIQQLRTLKQHIEMLGLFGGWKATLATIVNLERLKRRAEDSMSERMLTVMTTWLSAVMKLMEDAISGYEPETQIMKFSSVRVLTLIEYIKQFKEKCDNLCGIVFVEQRFTAKVLYLVLKALAESSPEYSYIQPDFMVGFNATPVERDTREVLYAAKVNKKVVRRFRHGETNLLVASNVVEEGIDIPRCTLVIKFDRPMNYRSYVQSKGRARHKDSHYVIMVPEDQKASYRDRYLTYQKVEDILQQFLVGKTECRVSPTREEIERELYDDHDVPPYYVNGPESPHVSAVSAISLLNRYCQSLQRDRYSQLAPLWYLSQDDSMYTVIIELPIISPLREPIQGCAMRSKVSAKRSAALEVCKRLHALGELNEHLLPQAEADADATDDDFTFLFTHWTPLAQLNRDANAPKTGTKKSIRHYKLHTPKYLTGYNYVTNGVYYVHTIEITPLFSMPAEHELSLLESDFDYALLTAGPFPALCDFPLFVSAGELSIHISVNHSTVTLIPEQVLSLRKFHNFVFSDLLKVVKTFLIFDNSETAGCILIVPTKKTEDKSVIDLDIALNHTSLERVDEPSAQEKMDLVVTNESHLQKVVSPWYRMGGDVRYIVIRVCHELNALSNFPSEEFDSYEEYFKVKYDIKIRNPTQPLLLVKAMSKKLNCLKPRAATLHGKRSKQYMMEGFEEHLVPEMCVLQKFPAPLWYKSGILPSILHRVVNLLRAENLRSRISAETNLGNVTLPEGKTWEKLPVDHKVLHMETEKKAPLPPQRNVNDTDNLALPPTTNKSKKILNQDYAAKMLEKQYPWTDEQEPIDIDRHVERVTLVEIEDYERFVSQKSVLEDFAKLDLTMKQRPTKFPALTLEQKYEEKPILLLKEKVNPRGPEQWRIYQTLISAKANEVLNLERLETLGDSFLKISVCLYLILKFPKFTEGRLSNLKGKMIGNQNLFYCGYKKNIGGYMKVFDFSPSTDWLLPGYCVPDMIRQKIDDRLMSVNKLFEIALTNEDQITGELSEDSVSYIEDALPEIMREADSTESFSSMYGFLEMQCLPDKTLSDCMEALIGAYLQSNGVVGALTILGWLGIIPKEENPNQLFYHTPPTPFIHETITSEEVDYHIPNYHRLEEHLGYHFQNRGYLLQALTHASYICNRVTDCYQRLEFLGDAVLDFLITCHIYEISDDLTPGQLTDLRSALVNNVTFAGFAVRYGFHKYLKSMNTKLMDAIDTFVKFQEERDFVINEEVLILMEENPTYMAEHVNVPKVLGDLFESLAGAVFLDSGMDLQATWHVFHRLMWREIESFRRSVPKSPVRELYEYPGASPRFEFVCTRYRIRDTVTVDGGNTSVMVTCNFVTNGKRQEVHGFGENKAQAKRAASKMALRILHSV